MNDRQENKLSMAKALQLLLNGNAGIISTPAALAAAKTDLDNEIATINGIVQTQTKQISGITTDKNAAKEAAIVAVIEIVGPVKSYAASVQDNTLLETVNYSSSDLRKLRDTILNNTLISIRDTVQAKLSALADFGIDAAMLNNLTILIGAFTPWIGAPKNAASVRTAATTALVTEFKKLDTIFERTDGLVEGKKNNKPDFYNAYQSARRLGEGNGGTKTKNIPAAQPQP